MKKIALLALFSALSMNMFSSENSALPTMSIKYLLTTDTDSTPRKRARISIASILNENPAAPLSDILNPLQGSQPLNNRYDVNDPTILLSKFAAKQRREKAQAVGDQYKCDPCQKNFLSQKFLNNHILKHNPDYMPYKCKNCPKKFKTPNGLSDHKKYTACGKTYTK